MMRISTALAVMLASVVLTGCGSFGEKPGRPPVALSGRVNNEGTRDATSTARLELELRDDAFKPTFLRLQPGQQLTLDLRNRGKERHTFTLTSPPNAVNVVLEPGRGRRVQVIGPVTGSFVFTCRFHEAAGMKGALFTLPGRPVLGAPGGVTSTTRTPFPSGWAY
jgi:plastocyanin